MPELRPSDGPKTGSAAAVAAAMAAVALLTWLAFRILPGDARWVGHDYSYFFPYMVAGNNWIGLHGWSPPLFTPDFCGGLPWLANPQSMFFSVPQLLATMLTPIAAARWTLILFATLGASGMYFLLRRGCRASIEAAVTGFVLFELNGFLLFRTAVGHLPFHVFGLAPMIAALLLWPTTDRWREWRVTVLAAAGLAAMVYAGAGVMILPIVLGIAASIALAQSRTGFASRSWKRFVIASLWSIPLAALKLVPAMILVAKFPRTSAPGLLSSPFTFISQLGRSLFLPESLPPFFQLGTLSLNQHELEYGVSMVPAILLGALLFRWLRAPVRPRHLIPAAILCSIALIVIALSLGDTHWAAILHRLPIIANISVGMRWWVVAMLGLMVGAAFAIDILARTRTQRVGLMIGCTAIAMIQAGTRSLTRYTEPTTFSVYDPEPATRAAATVAAGTPLPPIAAIARPVAERSSEGVIPWVANDGVFRGDSDVPCYEPIFDHDLTLFPATLLAPAPITTNGAAASLNLADPRCYLDDATCKPGSLFKERDVDAARRFAAHDVLPWRTPWWQRVATWSSVIALLLSALVILLPLAVRATPIRARAPGQRFG
jgi:hypothetical protein